MTVTSGLADRVARTFAFGPFVLVPERQELLQGDVPIRIGGRALDILTALVERPGEVVSKRDLLARVWHDTTVEEANLKVNMATLRRVLGEAPGASPYIATIIGRGYRFAAPVQSSGSGPLDAGAALPRLHDLPTRTTRIFGRATAIDGLRRDLDEARLVSIVGAGGVGKTTVALAVAEHAASAFKDGVRLIDLAILKDPDRVPNAIAAAIGGVADSPTMLAAVCAFLRDREMLLVLDNCEHVIDAAASSANRILADAAGVKILVTSREPLMVNGERARRLPGLAVPSPSSCPSAAEVLEFSAVQLFVERATDRLESFTLSDDDAPKVAEICRRLDGLALAIELAATRIDVFNVGGLLQQLDDRFRVLAGRRAGPERQRTLIATLGWSYGLLSAKEAALLSAVSVFAGVFDVDGASAASGVAPAEAVDTLALLAAKSLLATELAVDATAYRLLETTRAYCVERLRASGEERDVRRRHAEYVCVVLERAAGEWAQRPAREWGAAYGRVLDDLRGALAWAGLDAEERPLRIRLTVAGLLLWNHFSLTEECRVHVARAVDELDGAGLVGTAIEMQLQLALAGATTYMRGPRPETLVALQRTLDIAVRRGDVDHRLRSLRMIGSYHNFLGEPASAIHAFETFVSLAAAEDPSALPEGETHLGLSEIFVGRLRSARQRLERLHAHDWQASNAPRFARFLYDRNVNIGNVLAYAEWLTGSPDRALRTATATVEYALETKHELSLSNALAVAGAPVSFLSGRYDACARHVAMLDDLVQRHGIVIWRPTARFYRGALACAQHDLPTDGVEDVARAIAEFRAIHHWVRMPYFLGILASGLVKCGRLAEASDTIREALDRAAAQEDRWCTPELLRIQASILTSEGRADRAEALLLASMAFAEETGALSWRLRAATDLARLWSVGERAGDARSMLASVFAEFEEGFETRDLVVAAELLASLVHR